MLSPEQYEEWPEPLIALLQWLEEYLLVDIARRLRKECRVTATAKTQMSVLLDYGWYAARIKTELMRVTGLAEREIDELFDRAARESSRFDDAIYQKLGREPVPYEKNDRLKTLAAAQARQTKNEFHNMTGSMGFTYRVGGRMVFRPVATAYQAALDEVMIQIQSGGVSPDAAIQDAVKRLSDSGLRIVDYASGAVSRIDTAVRRAVVTGMGQISGKVAEMQMEALGTDLVEVSAHSGARDKGDGFKNHKQWQGKVYSFSGKSARYPSLREATGYGNVAGLKGANCRHDFHPFVEGASRRQWTEEALRSIDRPDFTYRGKRYTMYEATQRQRAIERKMRDIKLKLLMFEAGGLEEDYRSAAIRLRRWRLEYRDFSRAAGMREQTERAQVYGFGRGQAARALAAAKKGML